jgi:phytoene dehydrogenase-like protein
MPGASSYDAVVVGSGPNGLAAAITLARYGCMVLVLEGRETIGGGARTAELTLPGFRHDLCSAIHPLGVASPFFRSLPLAEYGLEWVYPTDALAHPLPGGGVARLQRSIEETGQTLGPDAAAYRRLMAPLVQDWQKILEDLLAPLPLAPRHPLADARMGLRAIWPARLLAEKIFSGERARALFAGMSAHSFLPLEIWLSASFGLMLGLLAHSVGWPMAKGGSQQIVNALAAYLRSLGGKIVTGQVVESLDDLPPAPIVMLDITPRQFLKLAGERLPPTYRSKLAAFRYGPGVFKIDYALSDPIPWKEAACARAGTVHLGGSLEEIARGEREVWQGRLPERPFVLLAQQSLFDPSRAPQGKHTAWAYCHVPHGSSVDAAPQIEAQIERFAPGFRDCILARSARNAQQMEAYNPNYVGGDINGGVQDLGQFFARPVSFLHPYSTPLNGVTLCSSSTPPGGGVHGMCGYYAARAAWRALENKPLPG